VLLDSQADYEYFEVNDYTAEVWRTPNYKEREYFQEDQLDDIPGIDYWEAYVQTGRSETRAWDGKAKFFIRYGAEVMDKDEQQITEPITYFGRNQEADFRVEWRADPTSSEMKEMHS
jgi:hypothetical protein